MATKPTNYAQSILITGLVALLGYLFYPAGRPYPVPEVTLPQGTVRGSLLYRPDFAQPVEAFRGIPYALPPIGDLRFARPQPVPESYSTIHALDYGARCPGKQLLAVPGAADSSEDCLTANVFRPAGNFTNLPVAVYFHGGAFNRGTAKMHDTATMVAQAEPLVAVSFNYRIGALGFLNSEMTAKEGLLNLGLRDQALLLDWVQQNIAAFGGNPDDVTLIGLSAGAHSIGHHLLNKRSVFHKAVMESGGPISRALHPHNSALHEAQAQEFLAELDCADITCLREADSAAIVAASSAVFDKYNPSVRWAWQPVIDNDLVAGRALDQPWPASIPILTGFVHNEGTMYVPKTMDTSVAFDAFFHTLLPHVTDAVAPLYPEDQYVEWRDGLGAQYMRVEAAYGQYAYVCPVRQTARLAGADTDVWLYHWAVNRSVAGGANHGDQLWYETMDPEVRTFSEAQNTLARWFHGYVTSFVLHGDPNVGKGAHQRPRWGSWREAGETMVFGMGNDERAGGNSVGELAVCRKDEWAAEQCEFWWKWSGKYED